jgi:hypothetical protein
VGRASEYVYDGQFGVVYRKRVLGIMSNRVVMDIVGAHRENVLSFWCVAGSGPLSSMGKAVEDLFWSDLTTDAKGTLQMKQWKLQIGTSAVELPDFELKKPMIQNSHQEFEDVKSVLESNNTAACMVKNCPLIDFAGPGNKVYQVTVSGKHSFDDVPLIDLLVQLGYLKKLGKKLQLVGKKEKLEFYWVVPYGKASDWIKKRPRRVETSNNERKMLQKCLLKHVNQHVLVMEEEKTIIPDEEI